MVRKIKDLFAFLASIGLILSLYLLITSLQQIWPNGMFDKEFLNANNAYQQIIKINTKQELELFLDEENIDGEDRVYAVQIEKPQDLSIKINGSLDDEGNAKDIHNIKVFGLKMPFDYFYINNTEREIPLDAIDEPGWFLISSSHSENENSITLQNEISKDSLIYNIGEFEDFKKEKVNELLAERQSNNKKIIIAFILGAISIIFIIYYASDFHNKDKEKTIKN